jgi:hypothetical protein
MNTTEIANRLNELAIQKHFKIAKLQNLRRSSFRTIFSGHAIFDDYFFHTGGRTEAQFNVGADWINERVVVRYGLAFSFQRGINLKNPIETISPRVECFNSYIKEHQSKFTDIEMWYHWDDESGGRNSSASFGINQIPADWISLNNFIFVGKYFNKGLSALTEDDFLDILTFFDRILPVYEYIEDNAKKKPIILNKISRLCWNTNDWQYPSGSQGKSADKNSYEYKFGYGHEEWLFDFDKLIDGYRYAFLQPVNKYRDKYKGQTFNILLYTVNSNDRTRYWVSEIKNTYMIDEDEENRILEEYRKRGWIDEIYAQIEAVNADVENFKEWEDRTLFNIRFKPEDVLWFDKDPVPFASGENISHTRYTLLNKNYTHSAEKSDSRTLMFGANKPKDTNPVTAKARAKNIEYSRLHNEIQNSLLEWLNKNYPDAKKLGLECPIGRASVDLALKEPDGTVTLYKVKTFNDALYSIRQAIGQLLEYSHYPEQKQGNNLVVVSHAPLDENSRRYILHLRKLYALPIRYMQFDHKKKVVIEEIG